MAKKPGRNGQFTVGNWLVEPESDHIARGSDTRYLRPQVMELLIYLARHQGRVVSSEELLDDLWKDKIVTGGAVYNCIAELRHAFDDDQTTKPLIETIPKKGYRLVAPVTDVPDQSGDLAQKSNVKSYLAAAIVLVLVASFAFWPTIRGLLWSPPIDPAREKSIAVLPFVPLSSGEDDSYFADGLTEEILNALSQLPELQVTARTSAFFFKGQNVPVPEIAARLSVAHVVEGSVRRDGDRLRVTAQLVRASDGFHIWSNSYDRQLDDVFEVQQDIAEHIASALGVALDDDARRIMRSTGIRDVDAFIAYQKGVKAYDEAHEYSGTAMYEPFSVAEDFFDRALEAAPGLTAARLLKTDRSTHVIWQLASGMREEYYAGELLENLTAIRQELDTARRLSSPGNQRDILDAERTLWSDNWSHLPGQIQVALQPGGCVQMNWSGQLIAPFGWADKLVEKFHDMLECDPMDVKNNQDLAKALLWAGDADAALQAVYEAESRGVTSRDIDAVKYKALLAAGRHKDAGLVEGARGRVSLQAAAGNLVLARQKAKAYWATAEFDSYSLQAAAAVGDRDKANQLAARIDSHPGGFLPLLSTIEYCFCGAPFDLDVTPNLKARIEEADFPWPPPKPINFPAKYW